MLNLKRKRRKETEQETVSQEEYGAVISREANRVFSFAVTPKVAHTIQANATTKRVFNVKRLSDSRIRDEILNKELDGTNFAVRLGTVLWVLPYNLDM